MTLFIEKYPEIPPTPHIVLIAVLIAGPSTEPIGVVAPITPGYFQSDTRANYTSPRLFPTLPRFNLSAACQANLSRS
jgi:hypothetical protein